MIVNHLHRFVFVHVPKTGGTSIDAALRTVTGSTRPPVRSKHHTLAEVAEMPEAGGSALRDFQVFCFVRNPWDRMVSLHRFLTRADRKHLHPAPASFADFIELFRAPPEWLAKLHSMRPQTDFVTDNAMIGRFENLERDFSAICERLGISAALPHLNATSTARLDYRHHYTSDTAALVANRFADEIARFEYAFDLFDPAER